MKRNVGGLDQGVRITLGPLLVVAAVGSALGSLRLRPAVALAALGVGGVLTATGLTQRCPANEALGIDTYGSGELSEAARTVRDRARQ
ncbi:YgaP family membrane protein [Halorussus marinus]|uniref:YgaP family membrane protein n=1 Tax=Halorussus marinus TaxID=2505976 RepID=UPI00106E72D3|nr:DUF2892 domain-containing protein [Halorussus marinus]